MIEAQVICDSISPQKHRLTTFLLRYPKFIHGEFMTHRVFSRNASSSRAVPVKKNVEEVRSDLLRAAPMSWGAEQKGMSPGEELSDVVTAELGNCSPKEVAQYWWQMAALNAAEAAEAMVQIGAHKSIVNRILEPFLHINVLVTATEYANFFGLRLDKAADPTMRALAGLMWAAYSASEPASLLPDDWHLPFVDGADHEACQQFLMSCDPPPFDLAEAMTRVSVGRCARLSYMSFETGKRSRIEEDLALYNRLLGSQPLHASPAEHQATPDEYNTEEKLKTAPIHGFPFGSQFDRTGDTWMDRWENRDQWGNFVGWRQYRKMLPGEAVAPLPEEYR